MTRLDRSDMAPGVNVWYYESRRGIEIIVQTRDPKRQLVAIGSPVINIPWGMLTRSAKRCGKIRG